jgi:aquaporin-8
MIKASVVKAVAVEFLGTFLIVFVSSWSWVAFEMQRVSYLGVGLANGLVLAACSWAGIAASGAHFNPVVTLVKAGVRSLSVSRATVYVAMQLAASLVAALSVVLVTPFEFQQRQGKVVGYPEARAGVSSLQVFVAEFVGSALYMLAFFGMVVDRRAPTNVFGFGLGAVIAGCSVAFGATTGGCINPARLFGPHIVCNRFEQAWVFWAATVAGGLFAGFYYDFFMLKNESLEFLETSEEEPGNHNSQAADPLSLATSGRSD